MTRTSLGKFDLFNRQTESFDEAELFDQIGQNNVDDFKNHWRPIFDAKTAELRAEGRFTAENLKEFSLQDAHWKWPEKAAAAPTQMGLVGFALECGSNTQGLMFVTTYGFARESSQAGLAITQVELLSTAPWNRPKLDASPLYKGVGRILLSAAVSLSYDEEHDGRLGLHALSGAESYYRDACGMIDLGYDDAKKMNYFEMTSKIAKDFIS